ncbi:hypothetical protein AVDCRST_MAG81-3529 [uncultured Synechococcales cyanobacterium]|uniref:Uncharacterized protein n=1 Tax=uncultured Synechococcales cyanobacterium TaxID=1936017 RepID=A0A6J4VR73_9CYAN|nr:hypothetical protein AVDCRST_MAG81-3529 [uncultured Synechococcales cyanobacterium]
MSPHTKCLHSSNSGGGRKPPYCDLDCSLRQKTSCQTSAVHLVIRLLHAIGSGGGQPPEVTGKVGANSTLSRNCEGDKFS